MPDTKKLFDKISRYYDLLNTVFSLGIDKRWRRQLVSRVDQGSDVLDVATGTAEVIAEGFKGKYFSKGVGVDPSAKMLNIGSGKLKAKCINKPFLLVKGTAEDLPFKDSSFDAATAAFGIRNTVRYQQSLKEMFRVIKPGGKAAILEFSIPTYPFIRQLYLFYFKHVIPIVGSIFRSKKEYEYLSESTIGFPQRAEFIEVMKDSGFVDCRYEELTLGIAIIYVGFKE